MDSTKKMLGVMTMAHKDYFFLGRWYQYYSKQVGAENLYVFSHGNDPEHRKIAKCANVINLPRDETMFKFDRRRWRMMSHVATGLLDFYNWMIVSDVDEIVIVDPKVATKIVDYLQEKYEGIQDYPRNIAPLCLELVHIPEQEPLPIAKTKAILSRRRIFRPNRNYSKPCLVGAPVQFGPGGHRNNLGLRHMPDDLYTLHLKFCDLGIMKGVAETRRNLVAEAAKAGDVTNPEHSWNATIEAHRNIVETSTVMGEDIELPEFRAAMSKQVQKYTDQFLWGPASCNELYRIPERFSDVF